MGAKKSGRFTIAEVERKEHGATYSTFLLSGWIGGQRVRRQFKDYAEALGEKNRLEVKAANAGEITTRNTRLSATQLAEAESAFARLGDRSLSLAVDWFLGTYRPPVTECTLADAAKAFLEERRLHVRPITLRDYKLTLTDFREAVGDAKVHEVKNPAVNAFLVARKVGRKRWNNLRGDLHSFFEFCRSAPRQWTRENPVADIPKFKIARTLPRIETAANIAKLFEFLETYRGADRAPRQPGFLVPYFALATFAGLRPSVPEGEICKLGLLADPKRAVDTALGVIRIGPDVAKTNDVRQVRIQPNLAAWLERYPLDKFPVFIPNMKHLVTAVRMNFGLSDDVLRHTYISMHVAKFKSMSEAALEAGNSESMIKKHYLNMVSAADAETFWNVGPGPRASAPITANQA